jgi:DNA-binding winged helix-turn-helix (wHTH) protein
MLEGAAGTNDRVELAHVASFRLGDVEVHPATRQLVLRDRRETLEPRVMQVLVALSQAAGSVVARDDLVLRCWDGRIVSESAINRVISRLRHIATDFGGTFRIETITKVGYRLTLTAPSRAAEEEAGADHRSQPAGVASGDGYSGGRRGFLLGIASVAAVALAAGAYRLARSSSDAEPTSSAAQLYDRGAQLRARGSVNVTGQVEAYFAQAVQEDPSFGKAWAALALARAGQVPWEQGEDQQSMAARARFAANRALQIDPASADAQAALAFVPSTFSRWAEAQGEFRRLLEAPGKTSYCEWLLRVRLSNCLGEVGRWKDAVANMREAALVYPDHPYSNVGLTQALWHAGEVEEAIRLSDSGLNRFAGHSDIWFTRMALLTYSSRPEAAVAFAADRSRLPFRESGEGLLFRRIITARALAGLKPADVAHAARLHRASAAADWDEIPAAARFFSALGQLDIVFELLRGYFFNQGAFSSPTRPPHGPLTRYALGELFWAPMAPVWSDRRFRGLAERIGLEDYWRSTGLQPDFRQS